jgi:hypothetical protein
MKKTRDDTEYTSLVNHAIKSYYIYKELLMAKPGDIIQIQPNLLSHDGRWTFLTTGDGYECDFLSLSPGSLCLIVEDTQVIDDKQTFEAFVAQASSGSLFTILKMQIDSTNDCLAITLPKIIN